MYKRSLLNFAVCSLLLGSLPLGLVGCKDYDDDITEINSQTSDLSKQLESLNSALTAAQNAANAAASDAKAAEDKADAATQEVALAKKAAEEAKAEAIEAAIAEVKKLQDSMTAIDAETAKDLAALSGRISGIEDGLSAIDLTKVDETIGDLGDAIADINKQLSAVNTQIAALENFKKEIGDVAALNTKLAAISTIQTDLAAVQQKAEANAKAIAANTASINEAKGEYKTLNDRLNAISASISSEVSNSVNTIAGILSQRLTSVTLIPDLYVGGIPTISFESAKYKDSKNVDVIISNNSATARYRLNPSTIGESDIKTPSYVTTVAQTRANPVVTVSSAVIKDGELVVKLGKGNTGSLNLADGKIYTASLKVPIADKHLFEGETEASVYSEFTRLEETYFTPELRFVKGEAFVSADKNDHLWTAFADLSATKASENVVRNIVYDQTFNLNELVGGCKVYSATDHQYISVADLAEYGLSIKYSVPETAYTPTEDKTDQQKFVKLSGDNNATLTPVTSDGTSANKVIIGKQPIIEATLYDEVNKNVVSKGYFKVRFVAEDMLPITRTLDLPATPGDPCSGASVSVDWKTFAEKVLQTLENGNGMSKNDFTTIYGDNFTVAPDNDDNGTLVANVVESNKDASIPFMNWTVTNAQLGKLVVGGNTAEFKKVVTFENEQGLYPDLVLTLNWTVNTTVNPASLGVADPIKWTNNTMKVTVVPMPIPNTNKEKARYNTNILEGREKPYIVGDGLASCAQYNIALAPKDEQAANVQAYYGEELTGITSWSSLATVNALGAVNYTIENNAAGHALVADTHTVKVNWYSNLNGFAVNQTLIGSINLEIVKILNLATTAANGITDNSRAVSINLIDNLKITDAYGNVVARAASASEPYAADYWEFYGVETPTFDSSKIFLATDPNATTGSSLASLNMQASVSGDGTLTFQNNGSAIASDAYLIVPVSVKHLWGTLIQNVAVPLKKKL